MIFNQLLERLNNLAWILFEYFKANEHVMTYQNNNKKINK